MATFEQFKAIELKAAKILEAAKVEGSDKLVKLILDAGDKNEAGEAVSRTIVAGIGKAYLPEELPGKEIIVVANLEPRILMGLESRGMLLAAHGEGGEPVLLMPDKQVLPGSPIS